MTDAQQVNVREVMLHTAHDAGDEVDELWLHHGDCIGADVQACAIATSLGWLLHAHPPDIESSRGYVLSSKQECPYPYLRRNLHIVQASTLLIATPRQTHEIARGSGTWQTIRTARRAQIARQIVYPDGWVRPD